MQYIIIMYKAIISVQMNQSTRCSN